MGNKYMMRYTTHAKTYTQQQQHFRFQNSIKTITLHNNNNKWHMSTLHERLITI